MYTRGSYAEAHKQGEYAMKMLSSYWMGSFIRILYNGNFNNATRKVNFPSQLPPLLRVMKFNERVVFQL